MEPEGSLPSLQEPATGPYPEPDESIPRLPLSFPKIHSNIAEPRSYKSNHTTDNTLDRLNGHFSLHFMKYMPYKNV
jgi:hypothetical protein